MITIQDKKFRNFAEQIFANRENDEKVNEIAAEMEETVQALSTKVELLANSIANLQLTSIQGIYFNIWLQNSEGDESEYWGIAYTPAGNTSLELPGTIIGHGRNTNIILTAPDGMSVGKSVINQFDLESYLITELNLSLIDMPTIE